VVFEGSYRKLMNSSYRDLTACLEEILAGC